MTVAACKAYLEQTKQLVAGCFPDLFFGAPGRPAMLHIAGPATPIGFIRLRMADTLALHLNFIEVFVDNQGEPANVAPAGFFRVSSIWPNSGELVARQTFLRPHGGSYGFHTQVESGPWAVVELAAPVVVQRMTVHNRTDEFAARAWGLIVETSTDGETWDVLYDQRQRRAELDALLDGRRRHNLDDDVPLAVRALLDRLATCLHALDQMRMAMMEARLPPDLRRMAFTAINEGELFARGVECTSHGIHRTFRFWSETEKAAYLQNATGLIGQLEAMGLEACLGFGAVLSILRDQDFIKHDDDVDIIVTVPRARYPRLADFIDTVIAGLSAEGYLHRGDFVSHRHVWRPEWGNAVDIFFGFGEGEFVSWLPGPRGRLRHDEMFPAISCELFGVTTKVPRNPFRYIAGVYGADWMKPQPLWNHNWDPGVYADWF